MRKSAPHSCALFIVIISVTVFASCGSSDNNQNDNHFLTATSAVIEPLMDGSYSLFFDAKSFGSAWVWATQDELDYEVTDMSSTALGTLYSTTSPNAIIFVPGAEGNFDWFLVTMGNFSYSGEAVNFNLTWLGSSVTDADAPVTPFELSNPIVLVFNEDDIKNDYPLSVQTLVELTMLEAMRLQQEDLFRCAEELARNNKKIRQFAEAFG